MSGPELMVNHFIGISLASSWAGLLLFMLELLLVDRYIRSGQFSKDSFWIRGLVFALISLDTIGAIISCASAWKLLVEHAIVPVVHHDYMWTTPVVILTTAIISMLEQSFLIYHIFVLSNGYTMWGFLLLLVLLHIGFSAISVAYIITYPHIELNFGHTATMVSFCIEAVTNIVIPISFVWQLQKYKTSFPPTQSLIRRVSIQAFSSGSITAAVGIIVFVLFWMGSLVFVAMSNLHGRIYSITVIVNLMVRRKNRKVYEGSSESAIDHPDSVINISELFHNTHLSTAGSLERSQQHVDAVVINSPTDIPNAANLKPLDVVLSSQRCESAMVGSSQCSSMNPRL